MRPPFRGRGEIQCRAKVTEGHSSLLEDGAVRVTDPSQGAGWATRFQTTAHARGSGRWPCGQRTRASSPRHVRPLPTLWLPLTALSGSQTE